VITAGEDGDESFTYTHQIGATRIVSILCPVRFAGHAWHPGASCIRLINASPDVGTVDVFVDGSKFLSNAQYGSVTDYLQLPSGPHKVELALIGKGTGAATLVQKLSVQAGAAYTVAAIGTKSSGFSLQLFVDDNRMVSGKATIRVYDLSPRSGTLRVTTGANKLIGLVSYRQASNYQSLAAGPYTFTFSSSQPPVTFMDQVNLKTGTVTSLFLVGMLNGTPSLQVIHVQVKGLPRLLDTWIAQAETVPFFGV
jgi:uncharacterized protein DUF4397